MQFFNKHPKQLWVIAFGQMWDTFSYYGTQTILALYFISVFHLDRSDSYLLYGAYAAFAFITPIAGGIIADKWLGSVNTLIYGATLNILGNLILLSTSKAYFAIGLAVSLVGSGLYKSNSTHLVGTLYKEDHVKKETGFTLSYLAVNVGGSLGPLSYGLIVYLFGWHYVFLCSAALIALGLTIFLKNINLLNKEKFVSLLANSTRYLLSSGLILAMIILIALPFYYTNLVNIIILLLFAISLTYLFANILKYKDQQRRRLFALVIISFFAMFYFAAGLQIGTTITLFIQEKIKQGIVDIQLPANTFSTLYCAFVLLLAPIVTVTWKKLSDKGIIFSMPAKLIMGIIAATIGIFIFAGAAETNWVISGVLLGNLCLSAGELIIAPAAYTAVSTLSPRGIKSTMMGCWLLFIAMGGYFSGILANMAHATSDALNLQTAGFTAEFSFIALFTLIVALCLLCLLPKLKKMMNAK